MTRDLGAFPSVERYVPARLLGAGGMGAVYEVLDRTTGARVALKVMLAHDATRLLRFKQEFRVAAELHHPNLVRLFDLGQHEGTWFFTMELVHGQDLLAVLRREEDPGPATATETALQSRVAELTETLSGSDTNADAPRRLRPACDPDLLVRVVAQILDALEFLHGRGIVHRDLKPSNILVDFGGVVRLLDFGLASRLDRAQAISQEGAVVGTLAYLSPEQYKGEPASPASDLYALGCMMFQLLTGELPFSGPPMSALAGRVAEPPPRVEERVLGVPPALSAAVHRLMSRIPAERPSIAELRAALGVAPAAAPASEARAPDTTTEIFVGRERELAILDGCLARAAAGEPQIALVSGPSGIGKSALGAKIARQAGALGFLCFSGRCYEREQVPFVAFDRVMDAMTLALRRWPPGHIAALRPSLLVLERIFPALGLLTGSLPSEAWIEGAADPREQRQRALFAFQRLCAYCQAEAPICFVLDDLQWADDESVALLSAMLSGGAGRVMVLGLFRAEGVGADHPLRRLLGDLEAQGRATTIPLAALDPADAVHLVDAVTGNSLDPETSETLASQTEGNPFLVRRLAEHLATLTRREQTARLSEVGSTDSLLREMITALTPRAERVLALAATAGSDIEASLLREASGLEGAELDLAVGELVSARLLKTVPAGVEADAPPRLDLYHDRIREAAYQGLAEDRRRALHRSLATALLARPAGRGRDAELLARHFAGAGERAEARRYAFEAAEQAAGKLAFLRAARLFREALEDPDPAEDPLETAARWERAGDLFEYGGRHIEAARAYQQALRRWDAAREDHPERAVARVRLRGLAGANLMATEHVREGREVFEGGLSLLGCPLERPPPVRLAVLAGLAARVAVAERLDGLLPAATDRLLASEVRFLHLLVRGFQPFWPAPAAEAALRAELLGRRLDDKRVLLRSIAFGAPVPLFLGRCTPAQLERAHRRLDEAERLAREHDVPLGRELVQINRALLWMATNTARARQSSEAALEGFARRGMLDSFDGDVARMHRLLVLLWRGDDEDALAAIEREIGKDRPNFVNVALALEYKAYVLAGRGRCDEAREVLRRVDAHVAGLPPSRLGTFQERTLAAVLVAEGRFAEGFAQRERWERAVRKSGVNAIGIDLSIWFSIEIDAALGLLRRRQLDPRQRRRLRASAGWLVRRGVFDYPCLGHRALALLDHAEGRRGAAERSLRRALVLSSTNAHPRRRWLCLEAARDLGVLTLDQETEAAELAAAGRFAFPEGWAR